MRIHTGYKKKMADIIMDILFNKIDHTFHHGVILLHRALSNRSFIYKGEHYYGHFNKNYKMLSDEQSKMMQQLKEGRDIYKEDREAIYHYIKCIFNAANSIGDSLALMPKELRDIAIMHLTEDAINDSQNLTEQEITLFKLTHLDDAKSIQTFKLKQLIMGNI